MNFQVIIAGVYIFRVFDTVLVSRPALMFPGTFCPHLGVLSNCIKVYVDAVTSIQKIRQQVPVKHSS